MPQLQSHITNGSLSKHILPLLQRSKNRKQQQQQQEHQCHPIFRVIEILENVFSFLGQHTLRRSARLVCRTWYTISQRSLVVTTTWFDTCTIEHRETTLAQLSLGNTTVFEIKSRNRERNTTFLLQHETEESRLALHTHIRNLTLQGKQRFKEVVLDNIDDLQRELYPLMSYFGAVTSIRMDNLLQEHVCLFLILVECPDLRNLEITASKTTTLSNPLMIMKGNGSSTLSTRLRLQRLSIGNMFLHQPTMENILSNAPYMNELLLVGIFKLSQDSAIPPFNRITFLKQVSGYCPRIESIHFSFRDAVTFESDHELEVQLSQFPVLRSFSFASKDATMNTLRLGQTLYHNRLTTLEIVGMGDTWSFPSESLHEFLCSSPQLLHLKAPNTVYYLEYFIMTDIDDFNKHPQPYQSESNVPSDNDVERDPDQGAKIRVWACQNLQTLHLEFCGRYGDDLLPMRSRIMFAYIAKVCPKIQDLQIRRCFLDLSLEGGWCFLSQLKELSRLRIETGVLRYITENDLTWIANPDTVSTWQRAKYQLIARQLRKKHSAERSNSGAYVSPVRRSDTDLIVEELRSSSGLDRVADILQTKSGSNIKVCWPGLEFLKLTYSNQRDCIPIAAYIRSIRPDLDLGVSQIKYK